MRRPPHSTFSPRNRSPSFPELSIVVAVQDDEERIGHLVKAIAFHLRSLGRPFEILGVNNGSRDNSLSILELLTARLPELRIVPGGSSGRAFLQGATQARGTLLVLLDGGRRVSLAPLGWALSRIAAGRDAVILRDRYIVTRLRPALPVLARASGPGLLFESVFEQRAQAMGLDVVGSRQVQKSPTAFLWAPVLRFLAAP